MLVFLYQFELISNQISYYIEKQHGNICLSWYEADVFLNIGDGLIDFIKDHDEEYINGRENSDLYLIQKFSSSNSSYQMINK